jgi:hypothetical protein
MAKTVVENRLDVSADQMHDSQITRASDCLRPWLGADWQDPTV